MPLLTVGGVMVVLMCIVGATYLVRFCMESRQFLVRRKYLFFVKSPPAVFFGV
jgi:hypothetical protein